MEELKVRLLEILKEKSFYRQKVRLSSGKESDYYIDARVTTLSAEGAYLSAKIILGMIEGEGIRAIGGPTLGADPIVGAIAALSFQEKTPIDTFIIRDITKTHGRQQRIEGPALKRGERVILVDDVATTGESLLDSIDVLRGMGVTVEKAICVVDRLQGAGENLGRAGCQLIPIFTSKDFGV